MLTIKQSTQKEIIEYAKEKSYSNSLSTSEREELRRLQRECKTFLKDINNVEEAVSKFKKYITCNCPVEVEEFYHDVLCFLEDNECRLNIIDGFSKWSLEQENMFQWMYAILDIKNCHVSI